MRVTDDYPIAAEHEKQHSNMSSILPRLLRISPEEATFARRRFHSVSVLARAKLEHAGMSFLKGYHAALADEGIEALSGRLDQIELEFRGFGFEGAAMGLDILDQLQPWKGRRLQRLISGPGEAHVYMVHVGVGWSLARLRFSFHLRLSRFHPLLRWLVVDGFGFHEGYFHYQRYRDGTSPPATFYGYGSRAFDQGLGRSLWFVGGADPEYIASAMMRFQESRRNDLWSGIGLACAYAGGIDAPDMVVLRLAAGPYWPEIAQGVVFAAAARHRAGNAAPHTELASRLLCGMSACDAAELSDRALKGAVEDSEPAYEVWRRHIRTHFRTLAAESRESRRSLPAWGDPLSSNLQ